MSGSVESLLGARERFRSASAESWRSVEAWVGYPLPSDYKEFVDGFGDSVLFKHLFIPHPEGSDPLLKFMQEERRDLHLSFEDVRDIPEEMVSAWEGIVPWAYHDLNGDVCLLARDSVSEQWNVAVAFRQCPEFLLIEGGITEFFELLLNEKRFPRGWPLGGPQWESLPNSPLV